VTPTGTTPGAATGRRPVRRTVAEELLPNLAVLVAGLAPVATWNRLPDPVASHWNAAGVPDAALGRIADTVLLVLVTATIAYGPIVAARLPMPRRQAQLLVAVANGGAVLLATVRVASVRANLDAPTWEAAGRLGAGTFLVAVGLGVVAGLVGWLAAGDRPDLMPTTSAPAEIAVEPGEAVVWTGGASGSAGRWVPLVLVLAAGLSALVAPAEARTTLLIVLPVVALAVAAFGQVRVTVGPRGLAVAAGWLGWPRLRVPIEDVADVAVEDVAPMSYGGWGLRKVPGATAVVVRAGQGLRVERRDGRAFVVTVDDAARGAGVLLAHRDATTR
jgi:uncharacterized membrane protein